jgi:hypothetical protein
LIGILTGAQLLLLGARENARHIAAAQVDLR